MPHMSQLDIRVFAGEVEQAAAKVQPYWYWGRGLRVFINVEAFEVGDACGFDCNCLIHTLNQKNDRHHPQRAGSQGRARNALLHRAGVHPRR